MVLNQKSVSFYMKNFNKIQISFVRYDGKFIFEKLGFKIFKAFIFIDIMEQFSKFVSKNFCNKNFYIPLYTTKPPLCFGFYKFYNDNFTFLINDI